jgi:hypothetical protein
MGPQRLFLEQNGDPVAELVERSLSSSFKKNPNDL